VNGHRETGRIRSKGFRRWLMRRFFEETEGAPNSETLLAALKVIEAKAHFEARERTVHVRVAGADGKIYLDLGEETWCAIEIDAEGSRVVDNPPVRFRRAAGMQALPIPEPGGSIEALRAFRNVQSDGDVVNAHVLAFNNVSGMPAWFADTLCSLATGGGFAPRQVYTDQDEVIFDACRPVIFNGIEDIVTRPDLADRAIFLNLEPIPDDNRRPEADLWRSFNSERPRILGALLDGVG